jgi:ribokinase
MTTALVSGLINVEVTLRVDAFPIHYSPVRYPFFGIDGTVSGVGYNVAKALTRLGDSVRLLSIVGRDLGGELVGMTLEREGISPQFVIPQMEYTPRSVILYDGQGRRQINVDLKDVQDQAIPWSCFERAAAGCSLAALCNVNFSRPFLRAARERGLVVATDVHTISDLEDDYNRDFMEAADVLFMSDEALPCPPEEWARAVCRRYAPQVLVIGLGAQGALLSVPGDRFLGRVPAVRSRQIVNTIGAGDALFSAFIHFYVQTRDPYDALRRAVVFASHKIGAVGAADGFLDERDLDDLVREVTFS